MGGSRLGLRAAWAAAFAVLLVAAVWKGPAAAPGPRLGDYVGFKDRSDRSEVWRVMEKRWDGSFVVCRSESYSGGALCYAEPEEVFVAEPR